MSSTTFPSSGDQTTPSWSATLDRRYEDLFLGLGENGPIEQLTVAANGCPQMRGTVWAKFYEESDAQAALAMLSRRFYGGRVIRAEFSPVSDLQTALCSQSQTGHCPRGDDACNYLHLLLPSGRLAQALFHHNHLFWERERRLPPLPDRGGLMYDLAGPRRPSGDRDRPSRPRPPPERDERTDRHDSWR
eukprot:gnl/Ergobibamus_cyprinoides/1379.p2 GENE.gnl/Ergobibamus_cyprinoides/1379~~gnl/Ergobibamus_cyprinoides/1379.p2  ORF type:complete len:189 (+),score=21.84 gnl/Ergobibamus_cyprinoides/1379:1223-1789(+)